MTKRTIRNKNLRHPVTVIREGPRLEGYGRAGARLKLDLMLDTVHGHTTQQWQKLNEEERAVLRQIAGEADPALGVSRQADAIGALGKLRDKASLLLLREIAQNARSDERLQITATHAMGEIGSRQVVPVLRSLLKARASEVRAQAAQALAKTGSSADLVMLEALAKEDKTYAGEAARDALKLLRTRLQRETGS
jgi:HEAT repeat protein